MHLDNEPGVIVEYTLIIEFTFLAIKSSCFKRDKMFRERAERERERERERLSMHVTKATICALCVSIELQKKSSKLFVCISN